ncbi:MAG: hypothetical protein ACYC2W_08040 [Desulfurivibrionaceae bacterium]
MEASHWLISVLVQKQAWVFGGLERGLFDKKKKWVTLFGEYLGRRELLRIHPFLKKGYRDSLADNPDDFFSNDLRGIGPKLLHAKPLRARMMNGFLGVNCAILMCSNI